MEQLEIKTEINTSADQLYRDWLDSEKHSAFTGGEASIKEEKGSHFSAWDGYITGQILEFEPSKRILQSWRTSEFTSGDKDSILEVLFEKKTERTTIITLIHTNLPVGGEKKYTSGWEDHYFTPMKEYYSV